MAVRWRLQRDRELPPPERNQEETLEHRGLRCTVIEHRSETGRTWLAGYVDLPLDHPNHGHDFEGNGSLGVDAPRGFTFCDRTADGQWRVGFDAGHAPSVPRAEFVDRLLAVADQFADRSRHQQEREHAMHERRAPESIDRHWLAVPYEERGEARGRGAKWDQLAKCWYAPREADLATLARWEPSHLTDPAPALNAREEFADALRRLGCEVSGDHPMMDGRPHRIRTEGDRGREKAGFYVASLSPLPSGYAINNRTGEELRPWIAKGISMTPEERAHARAAALRIQQERERERQRLYKKVADELARRLQHLVPLTAATTYLAAKGLTPAPGLFTDRNGEVTIVPGYDVDGKLWTVQYIQQDGTKSFAAGARQSGCCHPVGGWNALADAKVLVLAEGYSTALTVGRTLNRPTVACFNASNLVPVAEALHRRFPDKPILIAADDDRELERVRGKNPGQTFAKRAAEVVGGKVVSPIFAPGENATLTDFNDLAERSALGKVAVRQQLEAAVSTLLARQQRERARTRELAVRPSLRDGRTKARQL
jgi:phage/plasmid primase-like uncharacterized protein